LSAPNRIGTTANPTRISQNAWKTGSFLIRSPGDHLVLSGTTAACAAVLVIEASFYQILQYTLEAFR
jgi:hypothetical protein